MTNSFDTHLDAWDFVKIKNEWISFSRQLKIIFDKKKSQWIVMDVSGHENHAWVNSNAIEPHLIENESIWMDFKGNPLNKMSIHCEIPSIEFYQKKWKFINENLYELFFKMNDDTCIEGDLESNDWKDRYLRGNFKNKGGMTNDLKKWEWEGSDDSFPTISIGTAALSNDRQVIEWAVSLGYPVIDTASDHAPWYGNEWIIGELKIPGSISITDKLYANDHGFDLSLSALNDSLNALKRKYIDLFLIHHPHCSLVSDHGHVLECQGSWKSSWRGAFESGYIKNFLKYVGLSNIDSFEISEAMAFSNIPISVIQIWLDPIRFSKSRRRTNSGLFGLLEICKNLGIHVQAYSLLGSQYRSTKDNLNPILNDDRLKRMAIDHEKPSPVPFIMRWALENGWGVIPRSSKYHHIEMNLNVFQNEFKLNQTEINLFNNF